MVKKLVTIAIPAYKTTFLAEAIKSALSQTYTNLEVIVVDDKSPNDVKSVVDKFEDARLKYFRNETNLGANDPACNWNRCLKHAKGDFFSLLCDDDVYMPTFVEKMLELTHKFETCNVFRSRCVIVDSNGDAQEFYPSSPIWETSQDYMWHVFEGLRRQTISEFMYRTDYLKKKGGYLNIPLAWNADYLSTFKLAGNGGVASTTDCLVHFRMSGQNISSKTTENGMIKLDANMTAYLMAKEMMETMTDNVYGIILEKKLEVWKYHLDRNLIASFNAKDAIRALRNRKQYNISLSTVIKSLILSMVNKLN